MKKLLVALLALVPQLASASPRPRLGLDRRAPGALSTGAACGDTAAGVARCHVHVVTTGDGTVVEHAAPQGYGADDLASAYRIDATTEQPGVIAIVDAFGYPTLEADLAKYRAHYGLPACTVANGCLTIVNQRGATTPLPKASPTTPQDWTIETALDVDMASAACPACKILVVQGDDDSINNLFDTLLEALALGPTVASNSWGTPESNVDTATAENALAQSSGIAIFASSGDTGFDLGGMGPQYPSTSAHAISVGGTVLSPANNTRGWSEVAWPQAGSSCSASIPALATQTTTACALRAAADISAVAGDPGIAIVNKGSWIAVEGTSAAAPLVAGIFAGAGHGGATADSIPGFASALVDVTSGTNGSCTNALCRAGAGWDGPTGYGTPMADALAAATDSGGGGGGGGETLTVNSPQDGDTVRPGFTIDMDVTGGLDVVATIDGAQVGEAASAPYDIATPATIAPGAHTLVLTATDAQGNSGQVTIAIDVEGSPDATNGSNGDTGGDPAVLGGCAVGGGGGGGAALMLALVAAGLATEARHQRRRGRSHFSLPPRESHSLNSPTSFSFPGDGVTFHHFEREAGVVVVDDNVIGGVQVHVHV